MQQPNYHLELRTAAGVFLADLPVSDVDRAKNALYQLARVAEKTYGPHGSHRLVLLGPDHSVLPVVDPASFRGAKRAAASLLNKLGGGA